MKRDISLKIVTLQLLLMMLQIWCVNGVHYVNVWYYYVNIWIVFFFYPSSKIRSRRPIVRT